MGQVSVGVGEVETEEASGEGFQETDREMDEGRGMPRVKRETPDDPHYRDVEVSRRSSRPSVNAASTGGGQGGKAQLRLAPLARVIPLITLIPSSDEDESEESQTLLAQLRYGKVIKKISEIHELTNEDIKKMGEEMTLLGQEGHIVCKQDVVKGGDSLYSMADAFRRANGI